MDIICNIIDTIAEKRDRESQGYNDKIRQLNIAEDFIKIYDITRKTIGNNTVTADLIIGLLKENLMSDFFKEAQTNRFCNEVEFTNGEFSVYFPTSYINQISIKYHNGNIRPSNPFGGVDKSIVELADLTEEFISSKSLKVFNKMITLNCKNYRKNHINLIKKYINTYRKCNKKFVEDVRAAQQSHIEYLNNCRIKMEEYNKQQEYARKFVDSIMVDLNKFIDKKWIIKKYRIEEMDGSIRY